jgi:hypothetical protein
LIRHSFANAQYSAARSVLLAQGWPVACASDDEFFAKAAYLLE